MQYLLHSINNKRLTIRNKLRERLSNNGIRYFNIKSKNSGNIQIELCTVDRFQGHEADLVFLSMVKQHGTPFLRNLNRLNVAITRARYAKCDCWHIILCF